MNYNLNVEPKTTKRSIFAELKELTKVAGNERKNLVYALLLMLLNTFINLLGPFIIGYTIDHYIATKQFDGVLLVAGLLLMLYTIVFNGSYWQTILMGGAAQRILFSMKNAVFKKIQQFPVAFFNQNKAGDLISRVNSDTERLNQFFSQALLQFVSSLFTLLAAGTFMLGLNFKLGVVTVLPAMVIWLFVNRISPWVRKKNAANLKSTGMLSGEIQESLENFKVVVAFNRRDYFRRRFDTTNGQNYKTAIGAGVANTVFMPVFSLFANVAQLLVLIYGIYLIKNNSLTIGLLISFIAYANNFYNPIRQLATLWTSFQTALAAWDRISNLLSLESNLTILPDTLTQTAPGLLAFSNVHFSYPNAKEVLHGISFSLDAGKRYAFVGPTGGGKTTTASLMARLYDPSAGTIFFKGKDIRTYSDAERAAQIGFILQEPLLFSGTVMENILYGNEAYNLLETESVLKMIEEMGLTELLSVFDQGLATEVSAGGLQMSLGQKQLIAFMRAFLRKPSLLILDEATANVDTVTEQLLEKILLRLPSFTTLVIIAHRLNTIENADEIFFVNAGQVERAGSFSDAVEKLMKEKRGS
ncbi:MAG: ABC transporter ATP-binding protein [Pedobacter sp.]|jgi:ATP-binding cassette subfamily B protein|uniref:ABC transporter ATP-binding protein n=1 Tax=Pedobacter sp. TaxID=1411316 RepID=UPI003564476D